MSGNTKPASAKTSAPRLDQRVRRTRNALGDALIQLIQETGFDSITVQDVLDRAGVGRSTFYAHYRDKDDLLLSDVEEFFEGMSTLLTRRAAGPERVAPVCELFAHVAQAKDLYASLTAAGKLTDVLELAQGFFARSIAERLAAAGVALPSAALAARAHALAGALLALLPWWLAHSTAASPEEMDEQFHQMVWAGLGPPLAPPPVPLLVPDRTGR